MQALSRAVAVAATLAAASAAAQDMRMEADRSGVEVTVGTGFAAGLGYVYKDGQRLDGTQGDLKISDSANGAVPVVLELGYRFGPSWYAGLFGQYAYVLTKENPYSCPTGFDCDSTQWRFGPRLRYHFSPGAAMDPFVSLGFGFVVLNTTIKGETTVPTPLGPAPANLDIDVDTRGPEFVNFTIGGKWRLSESVSLGPALELSFSRYTVRTGTSTVNVPAANLTQTGPLAPTDDGPFGLAVLTLRGTYSL